MWRKCENGIKGEKKSNAKSQEENETKRKRGRLTKWKDNVGKKGRDGRREMT